MPDLVETRLKTKPVNSEILAESLEEPSFPELESVRDQWWRRQEHQSTPFEEAQRKRFRVTSIAERTEASQSMATASKSS
tara:strand:- start:527 stop:766 length:240 start_codon:yes stop_codon:yes gene_type:complete